MQMRKYESLLIWLMSHKTWPKMERKQIFPIGHYRSLAPTSGHDDLWNYDILKNLFNTTYYSAFKGSSWPLVGARDRKWPSVKFCFFFEMKLKIFHRWFVLLSWRLSTKSLKVWAPGWSESSWYFFRISVRIVFTSRE